MVETIEEKSQLNDMLSQCLDKIKKINHTQGHLNPKHRIQLMCGCESLTNIAKDRRVIFNEIPNLILNINTIRSTDTADMRSYIVHTVNTQKNPHHLGFSYTYESNECITLKKILFDIYWNRMCFSQKNNVSEENVMTNIDIMSDYFNAMSTICHDEKRVSVSKRCGLYGYDTTIGSVKFSIQNNSFEEIILPYTVVKDNVQLDLSENIDVYVCEIQSIVYAAIINYLSKAKDFIKYSYSVNVGLPGHKELVRRLLVKKQQGINIVIQNNITTNIDSKITISVSKQPDNSRTDETMLINIL